MIILISGISFGSDVLYIALTRWILRKASETTQLLKIIGIISVDCVLGFALAFAPLSLGLLTLISTVKLNWPQSIGVVGVFVMLSIALNLVDVFACSVFVILMLLMLLHRLIWPIIERPLYACARYGVIRNKKLLWTPGGALIFAPQGVVVSEWILHKLIG